MPRSKRELFDGGYYHILTRGNDRRRLFRVKKDYQWMLGLIGEYALKHPVQIVHYCLMSNHVHLLVRTVKSVDMPKFMQGILQTYAVYFRKRYGSTGYVFQNRYKSCLIASDGYLLECGRYIERNPFRAGIVQNVGDYRWSSFQFYASGKPDAIINRVNPAYEGLGRTVEERQSRYTERVCESRPYEHIVDKAFRIQ